MSITVQKELALFHRFIGERLNDTPTLSPEEALDLFRAEHELDDDFDDTVAAIEEVLEDIRGGEVGMPFEEFDREFRARHGLDPAR